MKGKHILCLTIAVLMLATLFVGFPNANAFDGIIKIGVIGPVGLPHWSPGMKEAAEMARDEINAAGGVDIGGKKYQIVLAFRNEHALPLDPAAGAVEMGELCDPAKENCSFVIGGFRTECVTAMLEVAMDYGVPFFIDGAATNELISNTVPVNYARYKYLFRLNPVNSTMLFTTIVACLKYYLLPVKLAPLYGHHLTGNASAPHQVRVAVLTEDLAWSLTIHALLSNPAYYVPYFGPQYNCTYAARVPDTTTDFTSYLDAINASQARLIIHVFSAPVGGYLAAQARVKSIKAMIVGINVVGQLQTYWSTTGGLCEYETVQCTSGTRTPIIPGKTEVFWDNFMNKTGGAWPLYTAWGAYDGVYGLKEAMEAIDSKNKDALVAYFENPATYRIALNGIFKYTAIHDVYSPPSQAGPVWPVPYGNVRAVFCQWLSGRLEVVCPSNEIYSKKWAIPPWMYTLNEDINYDGTVDMKDVSTAARAFGTYPGALRWEKEADINFDDSVDMKDISAIARKFGTTITLPLP